jgi:hypothetical protein
VAPLAYANGDAGVAAAQGTLKPGLSCPVTTPEQPLESREGSAGILYNLAEHPKSIRAVAAKLLSEALDQSSAKDAKACGKGCIPESQLEVVYRVTPKDFVPKAAQQALCLKLETETTRKPFR